MSAASTNDDAKAWVAPPPGEILGHPRSLWMLFSAEFWERFCF
jgi:POT family proton-dependent oligopeptide transporter